MEDKCNSSARKRTIIISMCKSRIFWCILCFAVVVPWAVLLHAQSTLVLSSGQAAPGASVVLNLTLSSAPGVQPAGVQWTLSYPAASVSLSSVDAGPALTASGKTINCARRVNPYRGVVEYACLAFGLNANTIGNGVVATVTVSLLNDATAAAINLINTLGASPAGGNISITATGGTVTLVGLQSVACAPATLVPGMTGSCTVSLSAASGGAMVNLHSNKAGFQLPASVAIPSGATSATFGFTTSRSLSGWAILSASLGGVTKSAAFTVKRVHPSLFVESRETSARAGAPVSLSCNPGFLVAGRSVICELRAQSSAEAGSSDVAVSSNSVHVNVPEVLSFRPGQRRIRFEVNSEVTAGREVVLLTADTGSGRATETLTVVPAAAPLVAKGPQPSGSSAPLLTKLRNAAGETALPACSPGSLATVEGASLLNPETAVFYDFSGSAAGLGGSQVLVNGAPALLRYASSERLDFVCPEMAPGTPIEIHVETGRATSNRLYSAMVESSPGVLSVDGTGTGQALAMRENSSDVAALPNFRFHATPALAGDLLSLRVTGVDCSETSRGEGRLRVELGGETIPPSSVYRAAVDAGACQVSFRVPSGVSGDSVPLAVGSLRGDGSVVRSNPVSIVVEGP